MLLFAVRSDLSVSKRPIRCESVVGLLMERVIGADDVIRA